MTYHAGQFASKSTANKWAKYLERRTGRTHKAVKTVTYRNLEPVDCWTVTFEGKPTVSNSANVHFYSYL